MVKIMSMPINLGLLNKGFTSYFDRKYEDTKRTEDKTREDTQQLAVERRAPESKTGMCYLTEDIIPTEVLERIMSHLDSRALLQFEACSRFTYRLADRGWEILNKQVNGLPLDPQKIFWWEEGASEPQSAKLNCLLTYRIPAIIEDFLKIRHPINVSDCFDTLRNRYERPIKKFPLFKEFFNSTERMMKGEYEYDRSCEISVTKYGEKLKQDIAKSSSGALILTALSYCLAQHYDTGVLPFKGTGTLNLRTVHSHYMLKKIMPDYFQKAIESGAPWISKPAMSFFPELVKKFALKALEQGYYPALVTFYQQAGRTLRNWDNFPDCLLTRVARLETTIGDIDIRGKDSRKVQEVREHADLYDELIAELGTDVNYLTLYYAAYINSHLADDEKADTTQRRALYQKTVDLFDLYFQSMIKNGRNIDGRVWQLAVSAHLGLADFMEGHATQRLAFYQEAADLYNQYVFSLEIKQLELITEYELADCVYLYGQIITKLGTDVDDRTLYCAALINSHLAGQLSIRPQDIYKDSNNLCQIITKFGTNLTGEISDRLAFVNLRLGDLKKGTPLCRAHYQKAADLYDQSFTKLGEINLDYAMLYNAAYVNTRLAEVAIDSTLCQDLYNKAKDLCDKGLEKAGTNISKKKLKKFQKLQVDLDKLSSKIYGWKCIIS